MKKITGLKRVLSVMLAMVLLISSMAVAGVSAAAAGTEYHYTFDAADGYDYKANYYKVNGSAYTNNQITESDGILTDLVEGGYNGSAYAMKMSYTKNGETSSKMKLSAFSVPNNKGKRINNRNHGQTAYLEEGATFRMTVTYKVTGYTSPASLYYAIGLGALSGDSFKDWGQAYPTKIGDITAATSDWQTMSALVSPATTNGAYFVLKMADDANREGTEVLIGAVDIVPVEVTTITFDSDGGSDVNPIFGEADSAIAYPAAPTKAGYEFAGWYDAAGNPAPVNYPSADLKLVAKWRDLAAWGFEAEVVGDELSINNNSNYKATVTDVEAFSGSHSLYVEGNSQAAVKRPQVLVKDGSGNRVAVEKGKTYDVSFWLKVPADAEYTTINYWLTATDDDDVYTDGTQKDAEKLLEVNDVVIAEKGVWQQFTATIDEAAYSGNVRLGITSNQGAVRIFYIDDLCIKESTIIAPDKDAWSFESEENGTTLDLNSSSTEAITVTSKMVHTGKRAVLVDSRTSGGDLRPQMMVKDANGEQIMVEQGKSYLITFWSFVPEGTGGFSSGLNFWFTASTDTNCYNTSSYKKTPYAIAEQSSVSSPQGQWKRITTYIEECKLSGMLRLGICAEARNNTNVFFYLDDIKVVEVEAGSYLPQDFEGYSIDEALDLNTDDKLTITVTDDVACNGMQSAVINSNTSKGNDRPQMMVKDGLGRQVQVYKGRNYEVTFSVFIPENQPNYAVNYWLAATDDEVCFSDNGVKKDDYVLAEKSDTDQLRKGVWNEVSITITNCARSGKLRLGITGNLVSLHKFYIDDLMVVEAVSDNDRFTESYEPYDVGTKLSLNTDAAAITVTDEERHAGYQSAQFVTTGNSLDAAPQMIINDYRMREISVTKGNRYRVSFWVMVPTTQTDYKLQCWLTASDDDTAFSATNPIANLVCGPTTIEIGEKGCWQQVFLNIDECAFSGKIRIGITGDTDVAHTFYFDDVKVEERVLKPVDTEAMNFENLAAGENISITGSSTRTAIVTDTEAYTGSNSVYITSDTNEGDNRPHFQVTDGNGELVKVEKGQDYFLTFAVMVPTTESYFTFSYWAAAVPEDLLETHFVQNGTPRKNDYVVGEVSFADQPVAGEWHEIKLAITNCKHDGYLRVGFTHGNPKPFTGSFYIDDIKLELPDYVTVKFDVNGGENPEDYPPVTIMSETLVPTTEYVDPYRYGYEFLGWYSNKEFTSDSYVDLYATPIVGENGAVITLYALWEEWAEVEAEKPVIKEEDVFEIQYYTEKVWVGDQNVPDPFLSGDVPTVNAAAPIVSTPDEPTPVEDGIPPWLIVVIIVAAVVVVGGGAAVAAILLKKNKKA